MARSKTRLFAARALLEHGWARDVRVGIDAHGRIDCVQAGARPQRGDRRLGEGILLPAMGNLHSHAFQRAMAGMSERRAGAHDDFWSWRELMYGFLARLTPAQIEAFAALVQVEMLEAGYAAVGEFHYVHHQPDGTPYARLAETSERIFAAAHHTGIGLTHLPVLYSHGGAGEQPLGERQRRFGNNPERYARLVEQAHGAMAGMPADWRLGIAPHSLRAVAPARLSGITAAFAGVPVHIHVAEQTREVEEVSGWLRARPVEWLLEHAGVDARWCLVHATHVTDAELRGLAATGAVAGLCPITEANLGDGVFPGAAYLAAGGALGVGSDSNVRIALAEELRLLEYGQRLTARARNVLTDGTGSVGETLYRACLAGGARALARDSGAIREGALADLLVIDGSHLAFAGLNDAQLLDGWLFAADDRVVLDVWSAGRHCVHAGRHVARDEVERRYRAALAELLAAT